MQRGYLVLPAYEIERPQYKGPRVFSASGNLVSPDLLVFKPGKVLWIEAKNKAAFTWYRIGGCYQDGIDKHHWEDYLKLRGRIDWPVWLLFLHSPGRVAKDNPHGKIPPAGLFGGEILYLRECNPRPSDKHGKYGMVYWNITDLCPGGKPIASWDELVNCGVLVQEP